MTLKDYMSLLPVEVKTEMLLSGPVILPHGFFVQLENPRQVTCSPKEQVNHCRKILIFLPFITCKIYIKISLSWNSTKGMLMNFYSQKLKC